MRKRRLDENKHPVDTLPFETFWYNSWQAVEYLRIKDGSVRVHMAQDGEVIEENSAISSLRMRSRKATLSDCSCILRPEVDVCVLSSSQYTESSDEEEKTEPVWIDAKISSIERKPHADNCSCQFYVSFYLIQGSASTGKRTLKKEIKMVQIDQIAILQRLEQKPCEDKHYRWVFSEDCISRKMPKLFTGKLSSDITWLVVASVLKQTIFDLRSIQNRIVYQIWDDDYVSSSPTHMILNAVNFQSENEISTPIIIPFSSASDEEANGDMSNVGQFSFYDQIELRRSKRRLVKPDRYLGCPDLSETDVETTRFGGFTKCKLEYEELPLALSIQADHALYSEQHDEEYQSKMKLKRMKLAVNSQAECLSLTYDEEESDSKLAIVPVPQSAVTDLVVSGQDPVDTENSEETKDTGKIISNYTCINGSFRVCRRKTGKLNFMGVGGRLDYKSSHKRYQGRGISYSTGSVRQRIYDFRNFTRSAFSESVYRELITNCMKNIEASINIEHPQIIDQWKEFQASNTSDQRTRMEIPSTNNEEEVSEIEMLWKEMELALASIYLLDETEGSHAEEPTEVQKSSNHIAQVCRHDFKLNEEIGIMCQLCGFVSTEIRDVPPSFLPSASYVPNKDRRIEEDSEQKLSDGQPYIFGIPASSSTLLPEGSDVPHAEAEDNVLALIPTLKNKLRFHQKRAFEFLWRNIAGSAIPTLMESESGKRGGCVISHAPGAGKTLLIIAFLVSYLKLFPGSRPLVLAPKTTLYTWYKEVLKWKIPIPVYQIHGGRTYRGEVSRQKLKFVPGIPRNQDVMHVLDCLEKIQKWLAHPSILLMGYSSFLTLTREDSKYAHRQYMGQVLRKCPGILILDEGHNPRSTKSRLRKGLMKVETGLRVLLSGTLFQNNFGEYFNTLCLARPSLVNEVLRELDPNFKKRQKGGITRFSLENRARKFFIDKIGKKIDSKVAKERLQGLNMLKNMTGGFIDAYEGDSYDQLPGLQCYTLMMKSTKLQQKILVKLQNQRPAYKGFPLELELLITLGAIHPWLITTTACASQYFGNKELEDLKDRKFDMKLGSKVRFVMSLVPRCLLRREKVLIFCHNIAPINLFLEIFDRFYGWQKGEEVLVLQGDLELFERGRVMDKFEEPGGASKVMLASITACAEGISLTAASRVILLDSEWNPSKSKQAIARAFRPGQDKVVYVYQLLASGTLEEEKYSRTTWKEWVSSMIFSEELVEDPSHWQAEKIEDELLREIVEEDRGALFHMIMKNEKASNGVIRGKE